MILWSLAVVVLVSISFFTYVVDLKKKKKSYTVSVRAMLLFIEPRKTNIYDFIDFILSYNNVTVYVIGSDVLDRAKNKNNNKNT